MLLQRTSRRRGSVLIENAIVLPVLLLILLGIVMLSHAVFHFQQVAHLAREGSRWASVHGAKYASETGKTAATADDVFKYGVKPYAAGMNTANLSTTVSWNSSNTRYHTKTITDASGASVVTYEANTVTVTVVYSWNTGIFGTIPVRSTSTVVMSY